MKDKQTPIADLRRDALRHYDDLANKTCRYLSSVPTAINFYYDYLAKLEEVKTDTPVRAGLYWAQLGDHEYDSIIQVLGEAPFLKAKILLSNAVTGEYVVDVKAWGPEIRPPHMSVDPSLVEQYKKKADKWDALEKEIKACYPDYTEDGEEEMTDYEQSYGSAPDLLTIGEIAAKAFKFL